MARAPQYRNPPEWIGMSWRIRVGLVFFVSVAIGVLWFTNQFLTERFTAATKARADVRQALYAGNLVSELQRNSVVPLLLSRDPALIGALNSGVFSQSSAKLISIKDEIGAASIMLMEPGGRTVAATDRSLLGSTHRQESYFLAALRSNDTVFNTFARDSGGIEFNYSRRVEYDGELVGVIVVEVDLAQIEQSWRRTTDAVLVTDSEGQVILSTETRAAVWTTPSQPARAAATASASVTSPTVKSATSSPNRRRSLSLLRTSRRTSWPASSRARVV